MINGDAVIRKGTLIKCKNCGKVHLVKQKTIRILGFVCGNKFHPIVPKREKEI